MADTTFPANPSRIAVIGAGPAGLMAAERISGQGLAVSVFDAMPSVARKFLLAGIGGMNITHAEDYSQFVLRYRAAAEHLRPMLDAFRPDDLRAWIQQLGIETFVGTSGRVFPEDMKAAPLLRAWLHRLRQQGVIFHPRHRWTGWGKKDDKQLWIFDSPEGEITAEFDAVVLALGGGSWSKLGSDGCWCDTFSAAGINIEPLKASNCGFELYWSDFIKERFAGTPVKNIRLRLNAVTQPDFSAVAENKIGEFIVTQYGAEGSLIYALSAPLRDRMQYSAANAQLLLDWLPHSSAEQIASKLSQPRKGMSFSNRLRKQLSLPPICNALLKECCPTLEHTDPDAVAQALKAMPLPLATATRPIDEVISTAGGVAFSELNQDLMLNAFPGVFIAGEMLDWEAPTGGYLLSACFATGKWAADGVVKMLQINQCGA